MTQLSFVIYSEDPASATELRRILEASGHAQVRAVVSDPDELPTAVRAHRPDALFAELGRAPHAVLDRLETIAAPRPRLLVCGPQEESALILRALKQGAREFLPPAPDPETVRLAVERLALELAPETGERRRAPVLAVLGAKGGVGATVVACQLAASLQRLGARTALVDLDLPLGDVALHLDARPVHGLATVAREAHTLDGTYLRGVLHAHPCGVQILAGPERIEEAELVRGDHVERVLDLLREEFDWVVVDVARSWSETSVRALDLASAILLVTRLDVPTLTRARRQLELLERLGHADAKIHVLANRHPGSHALSDRDALKFLGQPLEARLPEDDATMARSVNEGRTLAELDPQGPLQRRYLELARRVHLWCGLEPPRESVPPPLLARVRRAIWRPTHGAA